MANFNGKLTIEVTFENLNVPVGFGMGSSAASAAAAALACNKLFNLKLDNKTLVKCAGIGEKASAGTIHASNYTDTDTTYTAGTGLALTGTVFSLMAGGLDTSIDIPGVGMLTFSKGLLIGFVPA